MHDVRKANPRLQNLGPVIQKMRETDGTLLIVGGLSKAFPDKFRKHPRIQILGESYGRSEMDKRRPIPPSVVAVVFTKFANHSLTSTLKRRAGPSVVFHPQWLSLRTVVEVCEESTQV